VFYSIFFMIKENLVKISENMYEIPKQSGMNVPGKIFVSEKLLNDIEEDALKQVVNVAKLSGIVGYSIGMSDMHVGYGFPIGGVAAFDIEKGVISPGGVGYDINCSVRLLATNLNRKDLEGREEEILSSLFRAVPTGVGCRGTIKVSQKELDEILEQGIDWMIKKGYGKREDAEFVEENGKFDLASPKDVSARAKGRGINQLGTLGAGNHFLDVLEVSQIFDEKTAQIYNLKKEQIVILIHCGSRGLGHQVASDYIKLFDKEYSHPDFDRELVNAPIKSELGKKYLSAMRCAANFAFANKQLITYNVRKSLLKYFPNFEAKVVYDICHNIAKEEEFNIDGKVRKVLVLRKGATRSLGIRDDKVTEKYKEVGAPILIPGSMGTSSYVLAGTNESKDLSFSSTAHGAGRIMSRTKARKIRTFEEAKKEMKNKGIYVESGSKKGLVEEFPTSYKNIDEIVKVSHETGIGRLVAKLNPLLVVIG